MSKKGILGICNPIIDSFAFVEDSFLTENGLEKGGNVMFSNEKIQEVKNKVKLDSDECGGSGMNVARWLGILDYRAAVFGQYADDARGEQIAKALAECNVENRCIVKKGGITTNLCIFVTPDAQRTMMGIFGCSHEEYVEPVDIHMVKDYEAFLIEGYQFGSPILIKTASAMLRKAYSFSKKTVLVVSSIFFIPGYKEALLADLDCVTIITGTEEEMLTLFDKSGIEELLTHLEYSKFELAAVTLGPKGSYVIWQGKRHYIPAPDVEKVIDTTGAGDSFTAGLLYGYLNGLSFEKTAEIANYLAGYAISKIGVPVHKEVKPHVLALINK